MTGKSVTLEALIATYLQAREDGLAPDRSTLLAQHPRFAAELAAFFADCDRFGALLAPHAARDTPTRDDQRTLAIEALVGKTFGDYELLEVLGRGGMGVVFRARQRSLNRLVALKTIHAGAMASVAERQRFRAEAEVVASLEHPNIVPIYEVSEHEGQPFFSLKLLESGNLAERLASFREPHAAARLLATVARAVHHAHQRGVLHRDLKPGNILLNEQGEPHVTDFGLARRLGGEQITLPGAIVGTPEYLSPEQARSEKSLTTAVDVYGLGAVLYVLLTGRPPHASENTFDTLTHVLNSEPLAPRSRNPEVPPDLETVCLKCLSKETQGRYPSALALAEDLERWLAGEPIAARPVGRLERARLWTRRNPAWAAMLAVVAGLLVLIAAGSSLGVWRLSAALGRAQTAEEKLIGQVEELETKDRAMRERYFDSLVAQADANRLSRRSGQRFRTLELLDEATAVARELGMTDDRLCRLRNITIAAMALPDMVPDQEWDVPDGASVALSADGRMLATCTPKGEVVVRRLPQDKVIGRANVAPTLHPSIQLHPHGSHVLVLRPGEAVLWQITPGGLREVMRRGEVYWGCSFQFTGRLVALGSQDGKVSLIDLATEKTVELSIPHWREPVVALHPTRPLLAVGSYFDLTNTVLIYDVLSGRRVNQIPLGTRTTGLDWSLDGGLLAVGVGKAVRLYRLDDFRLVRELPTKAGDGAIPIFGPLRQLVVPMWGWFSCFFDGNTGWLKFRSEPYSQLSGRMTFSLDGTRVGPIARNGKAGWWRIGTGQELRVLQRPNLNPNKLSVSPDGRILAASHLPGPEFWDLSTGEELVTPISGWPSVFHPVSGDLYQGDSKTGVFRFPSRKLAGGVRFGPPSRVPVPLAADLAFSADGRFMASVHGHSGARLWRVDGGDPAVVMPSQFPSFVSISPTGDRLASTMNDPRDATTLWRPDGKRDETFPTGFGMVDFSADGRWLVRHGTPEGGGIYTVGTWQKKRAFRGSPCAISPDSCWLACDNGAGVITIEGLQDNKELAVLSMPETERHNCLTFSPDGGRLIAACFTGKDAGVRVWDLHLIGQRLRERGLGDDWPDFPPLPRATESLKLTIDLGELAAPPPPPTKPEPPEAALVRLTAHLMRAPFDPAARYERGLLLTRRQGGERDAIADLTLAIAQGHEKSAFALHLRGHAHERLGRWEQAAADFDAALAGKGGGDALHLKAGRGISRAGAGQFDTALADLTEVVNAGVADREYGAVPRQTLARLLLVVEDNRDPKRAAELAEELVRESPENVANLRTLGLALLAQGKHDEAQKRLDACLKLEGKSVSPLTWFALAVCRHKLGMTDAARTAQQNARDANRTAIWPGALMRREMESLRKQAEDLLGKPIDER